ncbi:MAG TPA: sigma-54-dependent Fis family transcriptional regulator [Pyrinomonadaceae bacterium]|nr:sigma-54-dependent Fis family transcriptional regulator [Pyrinomonadaceae bacterium]
MPTEAVRAIRLRTGQVIRLVLILLSVFAILAISFRSVLAKTPTPIQLETFLAVYPWFVVAGVATFLVQATLIIWLLLARARHREAEVDRGRLAVLADTGRRNLEEVVSNVPGIVWETGIDPVTNERTTTFISDYAETMLGYTVDECLSTPHFATEFVHEDDRERVAREVEAVFSGTRTLLQFRMRAKDGHIVWAEVHAAPKWDEKGNIVGIRGVTLDVAARYLAEAARMQSEERFRNMADATPIMIWMSGLDKGCSYCNQQWLDFTGRTMEEELGTGWTENVHPEDYIRCLDTYSKSFDLRTPFEMEYRLRRKDGEYRWIYDKGTPCFSSPDHVFLGYIGSCLDITQRKDSEVILRKAHEDLNRMKNQLEAENIYLQQELQRDSSFGEIVGESDAIKYVLFKVTQVAPTDTTVLITGETGTGKELVARAIHESSSRKDRPLIKVNCGALAPNLIESELFGHEKGAFTGADARKPGRFELADGGTIFLDEIGDLPLGLQVKLLRVIQENEFERLGGNKTIKADVRIIAATNRNLKFEVEHGKFREDLWYRLNVYPITVPPLRQRKEDIPLLVEHFVNGYAKKFGKTITSVSPKSLERLQAHSWPGNVRELANAIERAVIHAKGSILQLIDRFEVAANEQPFSAKTLAEVERDYIIDTLEHTGWRIEGPNGAANILGLNPSTLRTRMLKLGIHRRHTHLPVASQSNSAH